MSLAHLDHEAAIGAKITRTDRRIMILDIERLPGVALCKYRGLDVAGEFWDLSGWKHAIGRRIAPEDVLRWPRTICAAARWYGTKTPMFTAEWQPAGHRGMVETMSVWLREADIIVGHNIDGFDIKHIRTEMLLQGLTQPRPFKTIDTLKIARSQFNFESNKLDALAQRLGVPGKVDAYNAEVARAAVAGDPDAQERIKRYNIGDLEATEYVYDAMRGWMPNHPAVFVSTQDHACHACGSPLVAVEHRHRAVLLDYPGFECRNCGLHHRGAWHSARVSTVRPSR